MNDWIVMYVINEFTGFHPVTAATKAEAKEKAITELAFAYRVRKETVFIKKIKKVDDRQN